MVKPTVFSVEQDPKKDKASDVCLIPVKEVSYKSSFDDDDSYVTSRTDVCTSQRCACTLLLVLLGLGCLIGAGIGLYIHLNDQNEPTLVITGAGHPYGNDALYPPSFNMPSRFGGRPEPHMPEFHHGSRDRGYERFGPHRPPFPNGRLPFPMIPFGEDGLEPPFEVDPAGPPPSPSDGPLTKLHERPMEPPGPLPPHPRRPAHGGSRRIGPEYELHHGGPGEHDHGRRRGKMNRAHYHHSNLP